MGTQARTSYEEQTQSARASSGCFAGERRDDKWRVFPQASGAASAWLALALAVTGLVCVEARAQQQPPPEHFTLKQAVMTALQKSRDLSLARLQYQTARQEAGLTRSQFLPNLYSGSGAAYTTGFPLLAGGGAPALFSLSYSQEIFNLPARADVQATEQRSEQQRLNIDAVRDSVIARTASAYLQLAKIRREFELVRRERESAQKILDYTRQRTGAGYELPIEVTKAQLTAARIEQRLAQIEDQEDSAADELRSLLGLENDQPVEVAPENIPATADQPINTLVQEAFQTDIEVKQAENERTASEIRLKGERGAYWPSISLIGQYNVLGKFNNYDQFFNKFQRNNFIAGVDVKIPIFVSRTSAGISFAQANLTAANLAVANKRAQISLDVRRKARETREMDTGLEVSRLELELAQQGLQIVESQFQQGRASVRDVESAQLEENDKWLAFLDADFARQRSQLELLRSTGQLAQVFQ